MNAARPNAWANPSSVHIAGRTSRALLEHARSQVAAAIGGAAADVVFTSGGTEACNLGVRGLAGLRGAHVLTTAVEHPAVAGAIARLAHDAGVQSTQLAVPRGRAPDPEQFARALRPETRLCAIQWVNHETGTLFPVAAYADVCRRAGVPLFIDATQAAGKLPIDVEALGCDLLALASHKLGGPAGIGALWIRRGIEIDPLLAGGSQERGRRPGSPDVLGAVGFGAACETLSERLVAQPALAALQARCDAELARVGALRNAEMSERVGTVCNASLAGWRSEALIAALDLEGVCSASGAACSSGLQEPSPVLRAMHPDEPWRAGAALRLSFGPETTEAEVDAALHALQRVCARKSA